MALDIAILAESGRPEKGISISTESHARLMRLVEEENLTALSKFKDYYEDADFSASEISGLAREVDIALGKVHDDPEITKFLGQLSGLAFEAQIRNVGLSVIAD